MNNRNNQLHAFHLVDLSPWTILLHFSYPYLILTFGFVFYVYEYSRDFFLFSLCLFTILAIMFFDVLWVYSIFLN